MSSSFVFSSSVSSSGGSSAAGASSSAISGGASSAAGASSSSAISERAGTNANARDAALRCALRRCDVCGIDLQSPQALEEHLAGKKHWKVQDRAHMRKIKQIEELYLAGKRGRFSTTQPQALAQPSDSEGETILTLTTEESEESGESEVQRELFLQLSAAREEYAAFLNLKKDESSRARETASATRQPGVAVLTEEIFFENLALGRYKNIVVVSGAGISTSCGIPDFRSEPNGFFSVLNRKFKNDKRLIQKWGGKNDGGGQVNPITGESNQILHQSNSSGQTTAVHRYKDEDFFSRGFASKFPDIFENEIMAIAAQHFGPGSPSRPSEAHYFCGFLHMQNWLRRIYTQNVDGLHSLYYSSRDSPPGHNLHHAHSANINNINTNSCINTNNSTNWNSHHSSSSSSSSHKNKNNINNDNLELDDNNHSLSLDDNIVVFQYSHRYMRCKTQSFNLKSQISSAFFYFYFFLMPMV